MTGAIQAASIGIPDTLFIMLLALVVFGPRRLPEIGRQIGKLMYEFRKASNEFKYQMEEEMRKAEDAERRLKLDLENRTLYPTLGTPAATTDAAATDAVATTGTATAEESIYPLAPDSSGLTIQPPSTGETVLRGKSMSQLTAEAEALAEQTRNAIASHKTLAAYAATSANSAEAPAKVKTPRKPRAPKKSVPAGETPVAPTEAAAKTEDKTVTHG